MWDDPNSGLKFQSVPRGGKISRRMYTNTLLNIKQIFATNTYVIPTQTLSPKNNTPFIKLHQNPPNTHRTHRKFIPTTLITNLFEPQSKSTLLPINIISVKQTHSTLLHPSYYLFGVLPPSDLTPNIRKHYIKITG